MKFDLSPEQLSIVVDALEYYEDSEYGRLTHDQFQVLIELIRELASANAATSQ